LECYNYPKKNYHFFDKYDSNKRKDKRNYNSSKHKSKKGFDKEALKKMYCKKVKAQEHAFLPSLSDLDNNSDDDCSSSLLSDDESERKMEEKLTGLCFIADFTHGGFCTMAVDTEVKANKDKVSFNDNTFEVSPSLDDLVTELDRMNCSSVLPMREMSLRTS